MFRRNKKTDSLTEQEKASRTVNRMLTLAFLAFIAYSVLSDKNSVPAVTQDEVYRLQVTGSQNGALTLVDIKLGQEVDFFISPKELKRILAEHEAVNQKKEPNLVAFKIKLMQKAVDNKVPSTVTP